MALFQLMPDFETRPNICWLLIYWLVVWNIFFPYSGIFIIPTDFRIFFRGVGIPPTSICWLLIYNYNIEIGDKSQFVQYA